MQSCTVQKSICNTCHGTIEPDEQVVATYTVDENGNEVRIVYHHKCYRRK